MSENIIITGTVAIATALIVLLFVLRVLHYRRGVQNISLVSKPIEEEPLRAIHVDTVARSTVPKEDARRRKGKGQDYETLFIRNAPSKTHSGKTVYIRKEFHERITRIVQVIGRNELSLYSYLDNVLEHHFATYQEDISELYKKRNDDIF